MIHAYEARAARAVGVHAAVLLHDIAYWCNYNRINKCHFHDGSYWCYNSNAAFRERYDYLSKGMVERALEKLVSGGYVVVGNFNDDKRDRTRWFSVTEAGYLLDRNDECGEANTVSVDKPKAEKPKVAGKYADECREVIDYLREKSGNMTRHVPTNYALIRGLLDGDEPVTIDNLKAVIDIKSAQWKSDPRMKKYLRPKTLFSKEHFFDYLSETESGRQDDGWHGGF